MVGMTNLTRSRRPQRDHATTPEHPGVAERPNPQQWVGPRGAANILNVSMAQLYRYLEAGIVHAYRPETGHPMFWRPELSAYVADRAAAAAARRA